MGSNAARFGGQALCRNRPLSAGSLETAVWNDVCALLAHPGVVAVRVCTEKPDVYDDVAGVGIEVLRFKDPG